MKKQFHKIKIAAENFSRPAKPDKNSEELLAADKQVDKFKDVLEKIGKKFTQNTSGSSMASGSATVTAEQEAIAREKRCKKVHEYRLALAMEESVKELPDCLLRDILENCAKLEKNIANEIINNEINVELDVTKKLNTLMDNHITTIQKQKRIVTKLMQDNESAKHKHQAALRINENPTKITQLKEEQEECETRLEKERDIWAAEMFELIAEEENMANYIINYIKYQQLYYKSALDEIEHVMERVNGLMKGNNKRIYRIPLEEHLAVTNRTISYVIELCVCCLLEKGLYEEGLLRVGCAGTKLRRLRSAIDANLIGPPFPTEYMDVHVIAGALKSYLRDLPDPLLTYRLYDEFVSAALRTGDDKRKNAILNAVNQLPNGHYYNLRYLTKFLSLLALKSQHNKMSSQNIAIVMSPNLLWPPDSNDIDYVTKVNSSAAVNTIVEMLVSDWNFFFDGEVDFYVTMSRDELFPDNGGFAYDRDPPPAMTDSGVSSSLMTKSLHAGGSSFNSGSQSSQHNKTHSRSSSHDTSQILFGDQIKRSQSSSSLSDNNSSPPQSSPKLPVRRKHNKQTAPTPPDTKLTKNHHHFMESAKTSLQKLNSDGNNYHHQHSGDSGEESRLPLTTTTHKLVDGSSQTGGGSGNIIKPPIKRVGSNDNLTAKPEKPPRPVLMSAECQTLNRHSYRCAKTTQDIRNGVTANTTTNKPVALPRSLLHVTKSNENLATASDYYSRHDEDSHDNDDGLVVYRDKDQLFEKPDKPAIPERPVTLMRPPSFNKGIISDGNHYQHQQQQHHNNSSETTSGLKKNSSFRMNQIASPAAVNNVPKTVNGTGITGSNTNINTAINTNTTLTTLERTHIYNVDKKQVAIIDVGDSNNNANTIKPQLLPLAATVIVPALANVECRSTTSNTSVVPLTNNDEKTIFAASTSIGDNDSTISGTNQVPPSPRGFDPKIKRPQIPAPPPPVNRPKSDGNGGGGTNNNSSNSGVISAATTAVTAGDSTNL